MRFALRMFLPGLLALAAACGFVTFWRLGNAPIMCWSLFLVGLGALLGLTPHRPAARWIPWLQFGLLILLGTLLLVIAVGCIAVLPLALMASSPDPAHWALRYVLVAGTVGPLAILQAWRASVEAAR